MSWPEAHGAVTHFPVALLITAFVFDLGAALFHYPPWRTVSLWLLVGAVIMAVPSLVAGWMTGNLLFGHGAHPPATFLWHRAMAFSTSGLALLLLIWRAASLDQLTGVARAGSILLIVLAAGAVGAAGFLGGRMVFGGVSAAPGPGAAPAPPGSPGLTSGRHVFLQNCARCHGANGEGKIGPRLAGSFLSAAAIRHQVIRGTPPVMPAFGNRLSPAQINAVAAYVHSMGIK